MIGRVLTMPGGSLAVPRVTLQRRRGKRPTRRRDEVGRRGILGDHEVDRGVGRRVGEIGAGGDVGRGAVALHDQALVGQHAARDVDPARDRVVAIDEAVQHQRDRVQQIADADRRRPGRRCPARCPACCRSRRRPRRPRPCPASAAPCRRRRRCGRSSCAPPAIELLSWLGRRAAAAQRDAAGVQPAVDRDLDAAAELVGARRCCAASRRDRCRWHRP